MANPLKQLAGETAIYGMSTILARIINFFFVPFYTRLLTTDSYGVVTEFMAYIAILQVVLTLGLETGCFRFANKEGSDAKAVYSNALIATTGLSLAFLACMFAFCKPIAGALGYGGFEACIIYVGGILALDSITAILFAKLRQEHKAFKFAILKTVKIMTELGANLLLFFWYPKHGVSFLNGLISPTPDFSYVIFAILISCVMCFILFIPDLLHITIKLDKALMKKMLAYSIPLMIAGLPGVANDFLDRILFRFFDTSSEAWRSSLGVYQAAVKLAVIMNLFIQMFRFAAEPFFFQRANQKKSKELYAVVMEFFTAFCGLVFLGIILYIDVISLILGKDFRAGVGVVPIMLLSYMLLGMLYNVSIWYKLSERTSAAIWITSAGLVVTILVNIIFMPKYSYWAASFGHLASYLVMFIVCAIMGAKYNPFPYDWKRILGIVITMGAVYGASLLIGETSICDSLGAKLTVHTVLILVYIAACVPMLKKSYIKVENI